MLHWFITDWVEEEKNASQIIEQFKLIDAHGTAVLMLDKQLGVRGKDQANHPYTDRRSQTADRSRLSTAVFLLDNRQEKERQPQNHVHRQ